MTREELLASVHVLVPGDLLFVRVDREITLKETNELTELLKTKVPAGVDVIVGGPSVTLEQYRRVS
jgi:uncharacterized protein (DUF488 family)